MILGEQMHDITLKLRNIGWTSKLMKRKATYYVSINKLVIQGSRLNKGDRLNSYLCEDEDGKVVVVMYLD